MTRSRPAAQLYPLYTLEPSSCGLPPRLHGHHSLASIIPDPASAFNPAIRSLPLTNNLFQNKRLFPSASPYPNPKSHIHYFGLVLSRLSPIYVLMSASNSAEEFSEISSEDARLSASIGALEF